MSLEVLLFFAIGLLSILFAGGMLFSRNAIHSALFLIANFACVAVLFLFLNAPFISMVQIAVYAGAIMVLFLFVIMLLGAEQTTDETMNLRWLRYAALGAAVLMLIIFVVPMLNNINEGDTLDAEVVRDPQVRVAYLPSDGGDVAVQLLNDDGDVTLQSEFDDVFGIGNQSAFTSVAPGEYELVVSEMASETTASFPVTVTENQTTTFVIGGDITAESTTVMTIDEDITPVDAGVNRLVVTNLLSETPVSLVDLGSNQLLDFRRREVVDENGELVLDETGEPLTDEQVGDQILVTDLEYEQSTTLELNAEEYNLAFVAPGTDGVASIIREVDVTVANEEINHLILTSEPAPFDGSEARPIVFQMDSVDAPSFGSPRAVGSVLFTDYLLPVQVVGMLLLVALVGVVVLTRPEGVQRRAIRRHKVSRPLTSVVSRQTGSEVFAAPNQLEAPNPPETSGD